MTIQELMEKRAKVWEAAKNFVDTHENENGVLSAVCMCMSVYHIPSGKSILLLGIFVPFGAEWRTNT